MSKSCIWAGVVGPALSRLCETENRAVPSTPSPLDTTCHPGNLGYGTASPIAPCIPPRAQHGITRPSSTKPRTAEPAKPDFLSAGQRGRVGVRLVGAIWRGVTDWAARAYPAIRCSLKAGDQKASDGDIMSKSCIWAGVVGPALSRLCETENRAVPSTPSGTACPRRPQIRHGITCPSSTKPRTAEPAEPDVLSAGQGGRAGVRLVGAIWRDIRLVRAIWRDVRLIGAVRKYVRLARAEPFTESPT